jgi:hypothetical protein
MSSNGNGNGNTPQFRPICTQNDMRLGKNPEMKLFTLEYNYNNPNFNIVSIINMNIHNLLYEVNKDIIETIDIQPNLDDPTEFNILYKFRDIGGDLGGLKTYMYVHTKVAKRFASNGNTEIIFTSKSVPFQHHYVLQQQKYKLLEYPLYIQKFIYQECGGESTTSAAAANIQVLHMFKLKPDQETELTVAMENAVGILIKKMYFRLKVAIESLRH